MGFALLESKVKRVIRRIGRADNEIGGRMLLRGVEIVEGRQGLTRDEDGQLQIGRQTVQNTADRKLAEQLLGQIGERPELVGLEATDDWQERIEGAQSSIWEKGPHHQERSEDARARSAAAAEADRQGEKPQVLGSR